MSKRFENAEATVFLSGILGEFRTALEEEIKACTRNASSSSVPLVNGKRIAQIGNNYQYLFEIENVLNVPGDTPGDLYVTGREAIPVVVISIDGMTITLSIPCDLGRYVSNGRLQSNLAHLMRKLIERIEEKSSSSNPAGDRILNGIYAGEPLKIDRLVRKDLNERQKKAVYSSLGQNTTFIWGPPGTGKTWTIGEIGNQLFSLDRSLLVVSHTNAAVDAALLSIADEVSNEVLESGRILRVGDSNNSTLNSQSNLLLQTHVDRRARKLAEKRDSLTEEKDILAEEVKKLARYLDVAEWVAVAEKDIAEMVALWKDIQEKETFLQSCRDDLATVKESRRYWSIATQEANIAIEKLRSIAQINKELAELEEQGASVKTQLGQVKHDLSNAKQLLYEVQSVGWLTRKWRRLPSPEVQLQVVEDLDNRCAVLKKKEDSTKKRNEASLNRKQSLTKDVKSFLNKYGAKPTEVIHQGEVQQSRAEKLQELINETSALCADRYLQLEEQLEERLSILFQFNLADVTSGSVPIMLDTIKLAYRRAEDSIKDMDLDEIRREKNAKNNRITSINEELASIQEALKKVEEVVIGDASIVATTLTRAYLRNSIQKRSFDTVLLDEGSMAPIPALWIAATLASSNIVVVGDWKQLPPIVISNHHLAQKWLGKDIFEVAKLNHDYDNPIMTKLSEQHRMHPSISAIPNRLIYGGFLTDAPGTLSDGKLNEWYQNEWGHDEPVLLMDTGSTNAWVTSVPRGNSSSRLNFLSATICVEVAEQILKTDRPLHQENSKPRILIVCPYRPHARLIELLLRDQQLAGEVVAGTTHSFQGAEADIVIMDLVNDEPHWRVALFMPSLDHQNVRLLNVALTRAKRRLIIVGDFDYISQHAKKAFLGEKLIPFLKAQYRCVDALDIVNSGLAARVARAQFSVLGGSVQPDQDRLVTTQEHFYKYLRNDIFNAKERVVIYSPFITQNRIAELDPQLKAAVERGVHVFVITKARSDRNKRERQSYHMLEKTLSDWGLHIIHKQRMHEKLIFVDTDILWEGSLNPLSFSNTREHMERRKSRKVFEEYALTIRLEELLGEYNKGTPTCPVCGSEIVACEGRDEPFYWRCVVDHCYSRSIDQPPLQDGVIKCNNCNAPVEFGKWGDKPSWRCTKNKRHHQRIARTHLKLPKMRAIVPKRQLVTLDRRFSSSKNNGSSSEIKDGQRYLFDC